MTRASNRSMVFFRATIPQHRHLINRIENKGLGNNNITCFFVNAAGLCLLRRYFSWSVFGSGLLGLLLIQPIRASHGPAVAFGMAPTVGIGAQAGLSNGKGSLVPELSLGFAVAAAGGRGFFFGGLFTNFGYDPLQDDLHFNLGASMCSDDYCFGLGYLNVDGHGGFAVRGGYSIKPTLSHVYLQVGYAKEFNIYAGVQHFLFLE